MKLRVLLLLGGMVTLAGCSSNATGGSTATPGSGKTATAVPVKTDIGTTVALKSTPVATRPAAGPTAAIGSDPYSAGLRDLRVGQYGAAVSAFNIAIARHSHVAASWDGIGTANLARIDYVPAAKAFQKAVSLAPGQSAYVYQAAYAALFSGDYHAAVSYAQKYAKQQPNDAKGWHILFLAYGDLTDPKNQLKAVQQEARLEPNNPSVINDLGIAYGNNSKFAQSIQAFKKAISLSPNRAQYWQNLGVIEYRDAHLPQALADLERARALTANPKLQKQLDPAIAFLKKATAKKK